MVTSDSTRGDSLQLCQGSFGLRIRRLFPLRGSGSGRAPHGMLTAPRFPELQEGFDAALRHRVGLVLVCAGPGAGLDEPWRSLPIEDTLIP